MRIRRVLAVSTMSVGAAVVGTAGPAAAHEEIAPPTFPIGRPVFLTITAANESSADLVRIELSAPAGVTFGAATRSPQGWTATASEGVVTWTDGRLEPRRFEAWGFEIGAVDQPGPLAFPVRFGFAGGRTDEHRVEVTAVAPGAGAPATATGPAATATTGGGPSSTETETATAPAGEESADRDRSADGASGVATAALALSIAALAVALGAFVGGRRGRPERGGDREAVGAAQDW